MLTLLPHQPARLRLSPTPSKKPKPSALNSAKTKHIPIWQRKPKQQQAANYRIRSWKPWLGVKKANYRSSINSARGNQAEKAAQEVGP